MIMCFRRTNCTYSASCLFSFTKIMQTEDKTNNLFIFIVEVPFILSKDNANRRQYTINSFVFTPYSIFVMVSSNPDTPYPFSLDIKKASQVITTRCSQKIKPIKKMSIED